MFFPQHNSVPAFPESLDNLKAMNPNLFPIACGIPSLTGLSSSSNFKTPNFAATIPRDQLWFNPQPFKYLSENPLLQPSVLQAPLEQCLNAVDMTVKQLQEHLKQDQTHREALQFITFHL